MFVSLVFLLLPRVVAAFAAGGAFAPSASIVERVSRRVPPPRATALPALSELLASPPLKFERTAYMNDGVIQEMITGFHVTASGWAGLTCVILWSLFSPFGIVQYMRRMHEIERHDVDADEIDDDADDVPPHEHNC